MVDGAAASVAGGVIHKAVSPAHWVVQLPGTATACVTAHGQVQL